MKKTYSKPALVMVPIKMEGMLASSPGMNEQVSDQPEYGRQGDVFDDEDY